MANRMKKTALTILLLPASLFAAQQSLYCASQNPGTVEIGNSIEQVINTCGTPTSQSTKEIYPVKEQPVTQWIYNHIPNSAWTQGALINEPNALIVNFDQNNKITKIVVNGTSVEQTNTCNIQLSLHVGDTMQKTYQLCQWADDKKELIEKTMLPSKQQTTFIYQTSSFNPPTTFIFEDSQLVMIN